MWTLWYIYYSLLPFCLCCLVSVFCLLIGIQISLTFDFWIDFPITFLCVSMVMSNIFATSKQVSQVFPLLCYLVLRRMFCTNKVILQSLCIKLKSDLPKLPNLFLYLNFSCQITKRTFIYFFFGGGYRKCIQFI